MNNKPRPLISFSVDEEQKQSIKEYAKLKGFHTPANLARMALFSYMTRNPIKNKKPHNPF